MIAHGFTVEQMVEIVRAGSCDGDGPCNGSRAERRPVPGQLITTRILPPTQQRGNREP
jgi:hypothetical protein